MTNLERDGFTVRRDLKFPRATSPDGRFSVWFKAQSVYFGHADQGMNDARSMFVDARETSYPAFLALLLRHMVR